MTEHFQHQTRKFLARNDYEKMGSNGKHGFVRPLAEIINNELVPVSPDTFCQTMQIFITANYDQLEKKFGGSQAYLIESHISDKANEQAENSRSCKYVALPSMVEEIKPKDFFEIVESCLPTSEPRLISSISGYPSTRYIFINDNGAAFGPFRWRAADESSSQGSYYIDFIDSPLPGVNLGIYQIYNIDLTHIRKLQISSSYSEEYSQNFVKGLDLVKFGDLYDYASDAESLKLLAKLQSDANIKLVDKTRLDNLVTQLLITKKFDIPLIKSRINKAANALNGLHELEHEIKDALVSVFNTETGKRLISDYVDQNEDRILAKLVKDRAAEITERLTKTNQEIIEANQRLSQLNIDKIKASDELIRIKEESKNSKENTGTLASVLVEIDETYKKKKSELDALEIELILKNEQLGVSNKAFDIEQKISELEAIERRQFDKIKKLQQEEKDLHSTLRQSEDELRKKLTEMKPFIEAVNGSYFSESLSSHSVASTSHAIKPGDMLSKQRAVVEAIKIKCLAKGRHLADWQIANILISTQQSFITIFAGLPGAGKTSLARMIAEIQNIQCRTQEVAVARGWTSQKDLIGFFNPLTSRFQPAATGLYGFLKALQADQTKEAPMAYALLDEANLSPIEHYWSSFMGMTDSEENRHLQLGNDLVPIPSCLRFVATINYDGTTEELSPRLLNRAPIIVLENADFQDHPQEPLLPEISFDSLTNLPLSLVQMNELFGCEKDTCPELDEYETPVYKNIKKILSKNDPNYGRPVSISPRKEIAIRQYCQKAKGILNTDNELFALDLAILQHILPLTKGNGAKFGARLKSLQQELSDAGMTRSADYCKQMISYGEMDLHTYDFFCW